MNEKTITSTTKLFNDYKCNLSASDLDDLQHRLETKPYYLYKMALKFLKANKIVINYQSVSNFIKLEIRIRNDARNLVSAFEEAIWNRYILELEKKGQKIDLKQISKNTSLNTIIKKLGDPKLHLIRKIRNDTSHLTYFIMFGKMKKLIDSLEKIKEINFIKSGGIDLLLQKIKSHKQKLGFENLNFN